MRHQDAYWPEFGSSRGVRCGWGVGYGWGSISAGSRRSLPVPHRLDGTLSRLYPARCGIPAGWAPGRRAPGFGVCGDPGARGTGVAAVMAAAATLSRAGRPARDDRGLLARMIVDCYLADNVVAGHDPSSALRETSARQLVRRTRRTFPGGGTNLISRGWPTWIRLSHRHAGWERTRDGSARGMGAHAGWERTRDGSARDDGY
jgi:hypothetical protein